MWVRIDKQEQQQQQEQQNRAFAKEIFDALRTQATERLGFPIEWGVLKLCGSGRPGFSVLAVEMPGVEYRLLIIIGRVFLLIWTRE